MNKINEKKSQLKEKEKSEKLKPPSSSTKDQSFSSIKENLSSSRENQTSSKEVPTSSSTEFSPILYWREPIPDVEILSLETPTIGAGSTSSSLKSSDEELKRCLSIDKTIWLDKYKCDDAEAKYQAKMAQEEKGSKINENKKDQLTKSKKKKDEKKTRNQVDHLIAAENTYEIKDYGDKTLEDVLEDFRCDNERFRTKLIGLTKLVGNLQIRIGHLESPPEDEVRLM